MENLRWIAAAALSAYACHLAVHHTTPIDHALPLLAFVVTVCAWASYPALMVGIPLLAAAEIAIVEEPMRLLAFGVILAACCGAAVERQALLSVSHESGEDVSRSTAVPLIVVIILALRWIPLSDVRFGRELFLLACGIAIVVVLGRTPFAIAVAMISVLATPAVPLRTLALPAIVLVAAATARLFGMPAVRLTWPSATIVAAVMLFFSWSGAVARAFPYFLHERQPAQYKRRIAQALMPAQSATYEVPDDAQTLVISGANIARLRRGAVLGRLDPGGIPLRVGDAADWGYLRRDHFYAARNPLPRDPAGIIRDYGYSAWIDGAGRVALPRGARWIRVTADANLPAPATLQVEGLE